MSKKLLYLGVMFLFVGIVFTRPAFSGMECEGTYVHTDHGRVFIPRGTTRTVTINGRPYSCTGCGDCTPISSGKSSGNFIPPSGRLSPSQEMAAEILGAFLSGFFNNLFAPPDTSYQDALRKQQEEELLKQQLKQQEMKKQAMKQWLDLQAEAEAKRLKEEADRRKRGEDILAKVSIGSGELKMEPMGEGKLTSFSWDKPMMVPEIAPSGQYDTSKFTEMERLLCSAYFSKLAENAAKSGDMERARFYGSQMDNVLQGVPTAVECKPPKDLSMTADIRKAGELNQKYTQMATLYKEIMPKIDKLQEIENKLDEVKKKREEAVQKIMELDKQIEEIKSRSQTADTPEKKAREDDLLAQALALKSEAEKQQQEAIELEEKLTKEKQGIENELNAMKEKIQAGQ